MESDMEKKNKLSIIANRKAKSITKDLENKELYFMPNELKRMLKAIVKRL
jgi:hypothetical protein